MKKKNLFGAFACAVLLSACGSSKSAIDYAAPEEQGLNIQKITDESSNTVLGSSTETASTKKGGFWGTLGSITKMDNFALSSRGGCRNAKYYWGTGRLLAVSPDGSEIAYLNRSNKQDNIMIRRAAAQGASTQRTFRDIADLSWGNDGNLYFSDYSDGDHSQIGATNAHAGSIIRQLTNNNIDRNPVISKDGTLVLFTRIDKNGPSIWSLNVKDNTLTSCARGYNPCFVNDSKDEFICVRNSTSGVSEIWRVNYVKGQETLILSDKNRGFTNPAISPDGQWILCQGNSKSTVKKKQNLDIFAVRIDGSNFTQITYHAAVDCCPVWSVDGKYIYFLSTRGNKDESYNVWRMLFAL